MVEDDQRATGPGPGIRRVCIIGASGRLGRYMVRHCLDRGYEVIGVCREQSDDKLRRVRGADTVVPGATNDREVVRRAVAGCDGVLTVLVRFVDVDDQVEACQRVFARDTRWTVVRGSDLEEGESEGLPVWSRHVDDPILASNRTRRVDFALFMVEALTDDALVQEAPAIVGRRTPSARTPPRREPDAALVPHMRSQEGEPATQSMIEVRRLVKRYGDLVALDGLDLTVASGTVVAQRLRPPLRGFPSTATPRRHMTIEKM